MVVVWYQMGLRIFPWGREDTCNSPFQTRDFQELDNRGIRIQEFGGPFYPPWTAAKTYSSIHIHESPMSLSFTLNQGLHSNPKGAWPA